MISQANPQARLSGSKIIELSFDLKVAIGYKSKSQIIRKVTEKWVEDYVFCPKCGSALGHCMNNAPVADFFCLGCGRIFELKSKARAIGTKVVDGAYSTMIDRISSNTNPDFFFLNYDSEMRVRNFFPVPNFFFTSNIIQKRKPLSLKAKRAGWVGCNVLINQIPQSGKIFYICDYQVEPQERVLQQYRTVAFVEEGKSKGWLFEIMHCIEMLKKDVFSLDDLYAYQSYLQRKYPNNSHIRDKIRQQVQFLRDKEYLRFLGKGIYTRN